MLPYTPLHFLLMEHAPAALVMTSGNLSEEPLVHTNIEARRKLAGLADAFLMHDRDIQVPCDDSVVRPVEAAAVIPLRRARGLVPAPIYLPLKSEPILGVGAEQKNTFCVAAHGVALLSQHIGDLDSGWRPLIITSRPSPILRPCAARTRPSSPTTSIPFISAPAMPGVWPGCASSGCSTITPISPPAWRKTAAPAAVSASPWTARATAPTAPSGAGNSWWRTWPASPGPAISPPCAFREAKPRSRTRGAWPPPIFTALYGEDFPTQARRLGLDYAPLAERILRRQLAEGLNSPLTTSAGRLFDAVAAALNVCRLRTYEGQPAMELEMAADETEDGFYPAAVQAAPDALVLDTLAIFRGVVGDRNCRRGRRPSSPPASTTPWSGSWPTPAP